METRTFTKLNGTVEFDETYVGGGEVKNMHQWVKKIRVRSPLGHKTPVQAARRREDGKVITKVVRSGRGYKSNVEKWVEAGATVYTDEAKAYPQPGRGLYP